MTKQPVKKKLIDADALLDGLGKWKNDDPYRTLRWPWERWVRDVGIRVLEIIVKQMPWRWYGARIASTKQRMKMYASIQIIAAVGM